jgi:hypothetical protein
MRITGHRWAKDARLNENAPIKLGTNRPSKETTEIEKIVKVVSNPSLLILTFNVMEIRNRLEKPAAITVRK